MESLLRCGTKNRVRVLRRDELSVTTLPRHTHAAPALAYDSGANLSHNGEGTACIPPSTTLRCLLPPTYPYTRNLIYFYIILKTNKEFLHRNSLLLGFQ